MSRPPLLRRPFTETEIRSLLPSGWGIRTALAWDPRKRVWKIELYDGADQNWWIELPEEELGSESRGELLRRAIDRVALRGLGRKNLLG